MPQSENIQIAAIEDPDVSETFQLIPKSFGQDAPFMNAYYLNHETPEGLAQGAKRFLAWKQSSAQSTFLKAVSTLDGGEKIIGMAIWTYMNKQPPQNLEEAEGKDEIQ
ncbi:hypothetical protein BU23DRAFT_10885 [Bimuria novae-zelandiae CBS 107.79]|uniref:N-acetyltransferase domain-containing protein n=1 Tax=Bimuria novae-zelandiae CBS 107.79 TaxID=1447943 RepID=A0A6A5VUD9_9PLEO|nr:hypothetical protein BU23DRAFT_10885 [Bimuria novae-zelandiae CBS 107.79]